MRTIINTQNYVELDIQPSRVTESANGKQVNYTEVCLQITDLCEPEHHLVAMLSPKDAKTLAHRLYELSDTIIACK